ncbi:MAG: hypothetical protein HFJ54_08155, partial [Clostridia bacterium]|nr:hypothetical protein [Clostridia bacterium]
IEEKEQNEDFREYTEVDKRVKQVIKKLFTKQNILMYILAFMLSTVSGINEMAPFGIAIFAAMLSNALPIGITYLIVLIGTSIGFGANGSLTYILTSLVFIAMVLIFKPWYEEEYKSERRKLGKYVLLSTILVQIVQMLFKGFLLYDLFSSVSCRSCNIHIL